MDDKHGPLRAVCLAIISLLIAVSPLEAKVPETVLKQRGSVLAVEVQDKNGRPIASGSGFVVDEGGVAITNCRLISAWLGDLESSLVATTADGARLLVEDVISHDCGRGIVVVRLESGDLPAVKLRSGYSAKQGEKIVILGSRKGSGITVSEGTVKDTRGKEGIFQTTVPVTIAGSGGPVFDLSGAVIGVAISSEKKKQKVNVVIPVIHVEKQLVAYRRLLGKIDAATSETPLSQGASEKLIALIERAKRHIAENPGDTDAYLQLAHAYVELNRHSEAAEVYREVLRISPGNGEAQNSLALSYYKLGRYEEAIEAYKEIIRVRPDSEPIYNRLGTVYIIIGEYAKALDAFKEALKIDPGNSTTHFNLGLSYFLAGDTTAASEEYRLLKDLDKRRAAILYDLIYH